MQSTIGDSVLKSGHPGWRRESRLIIRSSEVVGYETGFVYDDHFPPSEPDGRGKSYHHIPFQWKQPPNDRVLAADCVVPGKGRFSLNLSVQEDCLDIGLAVRNDLLAAMGEIRLGVMCHWYGEPVVLRLRPKSHLSF